jgi:RNA polymerase sigma factor (sigma-70 family)
VETTWNTTTNRKLKVLMDPSWSLRSLSLAATAVVIAASVGEVRAEDEAAAIESIQRYCAVSWRNAGIDAQDWDECTQETLALLLERIPRQYLDQAIRDATSLERRELQRAIWCVAQRWRRLPRYVSLEEAGLLDMAAVQPSADTDEQWADADSVARQCLSPRQREILSLYSEGWTIGEIADHLQVSPDRASDEKYKAIQKLRQRLAAAV